MHFPAFLIVLIGFWLVWDLGIPICFEFRICYLTPFAEYLTFPLRRTVYARPRTLQPAKGQFRLLERNSAGLMIHSTSGSMMAMSAFAPGFSVPRSMPRTRAGFTVN